MKIEPKRLESIHVSVTHSSADPDLLRLPLIGSAAELANRQKATALKRRAESRKEMTYTYDYPMPSVTVDVVLFSPDKSHILCVKRKNEPYKGFYCLPGGYMEISETLKNAAIREVFEETNIKLEDNELKFMNIFDAVDRDTRGRVISSCFVGHLKRYVVPIAGDDAAAAFWISVDRILKGEIVLGFDHLKMLVEGCEVIGYVN
jgi:8-oxo-dGTP diphosphatase